VAQTRQVGADAWLRLADGRHQLAHGQLALLEQLQDVETGWVPQDSEEACRWGLVAWHQKPEYISGKQDILILSQSASGFLEAQEQVK